MPVFGVLPPIYKKDVILNMKYEYYPKRRTEQERRELNEQIIRLLQSEACEQAGVTDEDIFNRYTGDGGLHGLRRSDYENYNAFSAAKKELENGQFFTPPPLCEMIVSALRLSDTDLVADLTCGMGNFFNFLPNERNAYGCEVDPNACAVARKLYPQAHIVQGDIRDYEPQTHFDFALGNPPFHLRWIMPDATVMTSHQYYCLKAAKLLKPLGILAVIVPASFLADSFSDKGAIRMMESRFSFLGQVMLPEHAFSDSGVDDFPTKLQFWQKKSTAADWAPKRYSTDCADIYIPSGHPVMAATALYEKFVMVAKADLAGNRNKVFLELAQLKTTKSTFLYQVKKYLYQIRSHPVTREKYDACFAYVHRFYTQRQPADMPYEEWQRVQLTEAKVLAYLKQALCRQNAKPERDEIRLVKQKYSFVYKAYSRKMAKLLTDEMRTPVPIYQAVLNDEPERFPGYERLLRRKCREYDNQEQPFSEMTENAQLADWIGRFQYWDAQNHAYIHLNPLQSHDVNLTLQKRYAFLQWEQGSGKTPAAIFTGKHRVEMGAVHSIWVISSAISIRNNWDVILKGAGFSYVFVERLSDLQRIRPGDFVILTLNKVSQYKKQIGRYIKQLGYKIQFIFDESDNISNPSSKQTLSVLSCFRRCKYKLLTTGTSTRNNISEFAPQLELLYNNSINMISWCRTLYSYDKRSADMEHKENPYYGMPIPAYKKGYRLFANSHLPEKITVFGVGQRNQDIYNADELDRLLGKTVITRTFEEVTGKDIRRIHQMPIPFLPEEREVYNIVLKEFYRIQREYYSSKQQKGRSDAAHSADHTASAHQCRSGLHEGIRRRDAAQGDGRCGSPCQMAGRSCSHRRAAYNGVGPLRRRHPRIPSGAASLCSDGLHRHLCQAARSAGYIAGQSERHPALHTAEPSLQRQLRVCQQDHHSGDALQQCRHEPVLYALCPLHLHGEKGSVFPHLHRKSGIQPHADGAGKGKTHHVYEGAGRGYGRDLCQIRRGL